MYLVALLDWYSRYVLSWELDQSLEMPFVFDNLDKQGSEGLMGTNPPQQVASAMHAAWVAFATSSNPGWPQFDLKRRATMRFDTTSQLVEDPRSAERLLWEGRR